MKKLLLTLVLLMCLTGCASSTQYGECVGINDEKQPNLIYKYSVRNIVISAIFIETLFVPLVTVLTQLECPVGEKETK